MKWDAELSNSKARLVFQLLRTHHEASVAEGLSLQKSLQLMQRALFEATKPPPPPQEPEPVAPTEAEAEAEVEEEAAAGEEALPGRRRT
eukprot:SAG22_NODE_1325_length_4736_cov_5.253397_5_plen_89_part_00